MENRDYLAFVFKNIKGFRSDDRKSLLELIAENISDDFSVQEIKEFASGYFVKSASSLDAAFKGADAEIKTLEKSGAKYITIFDGRYPPRLKEIYDPPLVLFYRGTLPSCYEKTVGVVGTRYATAGALNAAFDMGFGLGANGVRVVSGLALGIDRHSHIGNMASGMSAIAVLGNGIDEIYPFANKKLGYRMLEEGGVIFSELGPGIHPSKFTFPQRNRIISGISAAVVVVQAPVRSGALLTADFALEQGRDLYVHSAGLPFLQGAGGRALVEDGAAEVSGPIDVIKGLNWNVERPEYCTDSLTVARQHELLAYELSGQAVNNCGIYYFRR